MLIDENLKQLHKTLSSTQRAIYLCGAGFSMSLGQHGNTWVSWLKSGSEYLSAESKIKINELLNESTDDLIQAVDIVIKETKTNGTYDNFMLSTIGQINACEEKLIEASKLICRNGDLFLTTNYDLSLEKATGLNTITYSTPQEILRIIKNESENKIIHLHGAYSPKLNIDDIIADSSQYNKIVENQGAQFIQNLLSTYPIIVVGCGGTVEDPNLKNFLQFAKTHLNLTVPYYYLYCKKDNIYSIPKEMIPVCYGENYSDLPSFLYSLAMHRTKSHPMLENICRVNPYSEIYKTNSAYSRMHYVSKYIDFIGRKDEFLKLNNFLNGDSNFSWWLTTGEAGMGKSRLLLEWLYNLPSNWFVFFVNFSNIDVCKNFKPFCNTVLVFDYVAGKEEDCAKAISVFQKSFGKSSYNLRIMLVERYYEPQKKDWFSALLEKFPPQSRIIFENNSYLKNEEYLIVEPLKIGKLKYDEEQNFIKKYLTRYVKSLNSEELENKYLRNLNTSIQKIHKKYRSLLKSKYYRPLYLSIFIEVWVYKGGNINIRNVNELLECLLEKEELRWKKPL